MSAQLTCFQASGDGLVSIQIALTADTGALAWARGVPGAAAQAQVQARLQHSQQRSIDYDAATCVAQILITTGSNTWDAQICRADANATGRLAVAG